MYLLTFIAADLFVEEGRVSRFTRKEESSAKGMMMGESRAIPLPPAFCARRTLPESRQVIEGALLGFLLSFLPLVLASVRSGCRRPTPTAQA
jgi:hypothetical protein